MRRDEIEKINRKRDDFLRAIKESDIAYIKDFFPHFNGDFVNGKRM